MEDRLELCYEALMCKHYALLGTKSDVSPIHWQNGAIARLNPGESIDKFLKYDYSNITLGFVGINDVIKLLSIKFNWNDIDKEENKSKIIKYLQTKAQSWKKMSGLNFNIEETKDSEANCRLYKIDKYKYEQVTNETNKKSY